MQPQPAEVLEAPGAAVQPGRAEEVQKRVVDPARMAAQTALDQAFEPFDNAMDARGAAQSEKLSQ